MKLGMAEEGGGGKGDGKKGDVSVCRDFLRNVCTRGDRWVLLIDITMSLMDAD